MTDLATITDKLEIIEICKKAHWYYDHNAWDHLDRVFAPIVSMPTVAQVSNDADFDVATYLNRYLVTVDQIKSGLQSFKQGLCTQHLIAGHQVALGGDQAICLAHSINIHLPSASNSDDEMLAHGNEYRFDLDRTNEGWRIRGWVPRVRWSYGNEDSHDVTSKQSAWLDSKASS